MSTLKQARNQIELTGTISEIEWGESRNGQIANLTVVSNYTVPSGDGDPKIKNQWYRVGVFKPDDLTLAESLKVGDAVRVFGKMRNQAYKDTKGIDQIGLQIQVAGRDAKLEKTPPRGLDLADFNQAKVVGNLGADPVISEDRRFAFLNVATNEEWKDKITADPKKDTQWHSIGVFEPRLVVAASKLKKGDLVSIEGAVRHTSRTDDEGNKRSGSQIQLNGPDARLQFVSAQKTQETQQHQSRAKGRSA